MQRAEIEPKLDAEQEYSAIESALLETARGRWFLAEHSRRSRRMETLELEGALDLLKSSLRDPPALLGRLKTELDSINEMVRATRSELLAREKLAPRASGEQGEPAPSPACSRPRRTCTNSSGRCNRATSIRSCASRSAGRPPPSSR